MSEAARVARFFRLLSAADKALELRRLVAGTPARAKVFDAPLELFEALPGSPFAYWSPPRLAE